MSGFDAKTYSFEDIVGSLTKMNSLNSLGNFPRTDSESAFQEFLKRIPSSNSLAAFGGHGGSQADLAAQAAQLHSLQASLASQAALHPASAPPEASGASPSGAGGGVPRVASLDFFRQLLPVNQLNVSGARPAAGGTGDDGEGGSGLRRNGGKVEPSAGSAFSPPPPSFPSELPPIPGVGGGPNLSTSMAEPVRVLPLRAPSPITGTSGAASGGAAGGGGGGGGGVVRNSSFLPPVPTSAPMTEREKELAAKAELRRARRMLSNRESARRSRKRKQEHLGELQGQIAALQEQKEELEDELESARAQLKRKDQEIGQLRAQNDQLRAQFDGEAAPRAGAKVHAATSPRGNESKPPLPSGKLKGFKRKTADADGDA